MTAEEIYQDLLDFVDEKGFLDENKWEYFEATCTFTNDDNEESLMGRKTEFKANVKDRLDLCLKQKYKSIKIGGGLYCFYESDKLIYLGRGSDLRERLIIHFKALYNIGGNEVYREFFKDYRNKKLDVKYLRIPHVNSKTMQAVTIILERLLLHRDMPEFEKLHPSQK